MTNARVLRADIRSESECWLAACMRVPHVDVYFLPEYSYIYERHGDGEARCFILENRDGLILYPFLLRSIRAADSANPTAEKLLDTTTPYGYGGPLISPTPAGNAAALVQAFRESFHAYCLEMGIVSEFSRLHPLLANHELLPPETLIYHHETVSVDLTWDDADLWADIRKGHKSSIKKAQREGVVVKPAGTEDALSTLFGLYTETMERQRASSWYFLSKAFFRDTLHLLGEHAVIFTAQHAGKTTNVALFLQCGEFAHYHFAGAAAESLHLGGNHLLIWQAMKWARATGAKYLHLGGGLSPDDPLYRFKSGFSSNRAPFHTYRVIHDKHTYSPLVEERTRCADAAGRAIDDEYFPKYRA